MPDIQARTADGVIHSFPDGTPDDVVDKAIKSYISSIPPTEAQANAKPPIAPMPKINVQPDAFNKNETPLGVPISPAGAAASLPRAAVGLAGGYGAGKVADYFDPDHKHPWLHDAAVMGGSIAAESTAMGARSVGKFASRATLEAPEKINLPGGFKINRNLPPPPEPEVSMEETATRNAAQKVAQRAADEKAGLRRPSADVEAERVAKAHEAAMNKEASEHDAIRQRYETEKTAQAKAEQAEQAHREKLGKQKMDADAAQQKYFDDLDKAEKVKADAEARQTELKQQRDKLAAEREGKRKMSADAAQEKFYQSQSDEMDQKISDNEKEVNKAHADWDRLSTQHGSDLMKRGREIKQMEGEAERLTGETAKATTKAAGTKTELGQRLAKLNALRVARAEAEAQAGGPSSVSPDVWKELAPIDKARITARYENTKARASERGMVHAARGESGAQLSNDAMRARVGLPPPPEP